MLPPGFFQLSENTLIPFRCCQSHVVFGKWIFDEKIPVKRYTFVCGFALWKAQKFSILSNFIQWNLFFAICLLNDSRKLKKVVICKQLNIILKWAITRNGQLCPLNLSLIESMSVALIPKNYTLLSNFNARRKDAVSIKEALINTFILLLV